MEPCASEIIEVIAGIFSSSTLIWFNMHGILIILSSRLLMLFGRGGNDVAVGLIVQHNRTLQMSVKKGVWSPEEDAKMMAYVSKNGTGNWTAVPKKAGLRRCGKSCRLRWNNYLRPDLKHDNFSPQEEELIIKLHGAIGTRWSIIAQQLPGRTDNDVKNYWNSKLKKKLHDMGIDPVTHKPYSQILADYGNIGGNRNFNHGRIGSLNKDLKNAFSQIEGNSDDRFMHFNNSSRSSLMMHSDVRAPGALKCESVDESMHLLDQLQAIKKFTEASNCGKSIETATVVFHPQWGNSMMSPASSSSSSACSAGNNPSFQGLNWQDYLLDDVFAPHDTPQNDLTEYFTSSSTDDIHIVEAQNPVELLEFKPNKNIVNLDAATHGSGATNCSPDASFLDEMLAGENEMMLLEFPSLLDDSTFESQA
ncbi:unnamed protein product [Rhodiola kirilowii]